jgi:glycosyltransferase involved in cell wall biosynthesis
MRVLFAPDWRSGNPYQTLLAEALSRHEVEYNVEVEFLSSYHRGLPLFRGSRRKIPDIVHIHWPEAYFQVWNDQWDSLRVLRYPLDLWLTARNFPIVLTAHNLLPHDRANERGAARNMRHTARSSKAVFVHSNAARRRIRETFGVSDRGIHVIPFGDHSVGMGPPLPRDEARSELKLQLEAKICLVFGTVSPYKGSDELVKFWAQNNLPYQLVVIGPVLSEAFASRLSELARGCPTIHLHLLDKWLDDAELRLWLSACDCSIFNYRKIFTSGAAALARSYGVPLLIPRRLDAADLDEPHSHVLRFDTLDTDFRAQLDRAIVRGRDYQAGEEWRRKTSWERVAEMTAAVYNDVLKTAPSPALGNR